MFGSWNDQAKIQQWQANRNATPAFRGMGPGGGTAWGYNGGRTFLRGGQSGQQQQPQTQQRQYLGPVFNQPQQQQQPLFGGDLTQQMVNQNWADAFTNSDANYLMKQIQRPGISQSAGTMAGVMPQIGSNIADANAFQNTLPLQHEMANAQDLAANQYDQGQETLGNFNILRQLQNQQWNMQSQLLGALSPLFGGLFQ